MENYKKNIDLKIKNNAIIAYLFIFVNIFFLLSKSNPLLNNSFVKSHTKTAIIIHIWFLINTLVFAYFWIGLYWELMWYSISDIIAISIYLVLFIIMIIWMYKAYNNELFKIWETVSYKNNEKLLDITLDWNFNEKDKVTIIMSKVPFIWFFIYPKYKKNKLIWNNTRLNLYITLLLLLLYIFWNPNLANLLLLLYIIFIVFSAINLFIKNEVINISVAKLPSWDDILNYMEVLRIYMWNYFSTKKEFPKFEDILKQIPLKRGEKSKAETLALNKLNDFKLWKYLIYIPVLNIICLFNLNSKQKVHIINWILISIAFLVLAIIYSIENKYQLLLLIPLVFALWNLNSWVLNYKIPFLYNIFEILISVKNFLSNILNKVKVIKNTEKEINLKVK
jgi:uncharacterized membrane protein